MDYFDRLEAETNHLYEIANKARSRGLDVETETEVPLAKDLAERVEGLVGPEGVAQRIKELEAEDLSFCKLSLPINISVRENFLSISKIL